MRNGLHASSSNKHAREEIRLLFPDYEFLKTKPMPLHTSNQSSMSLFNLNWYHCSIQRKGRRRGRRFQLELKMICTILNHGVRRLK